MNIPFVRKLLFLVVILPSIVFGAGYEFEGIGARQVARGGAVIADADDWTAIYWNPGNIAKAVENNRKQVGLELFGGKVSVKDTNSLSSINGLGSIFSRQHNTSSYLLGALGMIWPVGKQGGMGVGFYTPLLQGSSFQDTANSLGTSLDYKSRAGILVWNASLSWKLSSRLYAGMGLNLLYGVIENKSFLITPIDRLSGDLMGDGLGLEGVFGARLEVSRKVSLGMVYRTGDDVRLKGSATATSTLLPHESTDFSYALRHPPTFGTGISFKPTPRWRGGLDLNRTFWGRFSNAINYDRPGTILADTPNTFDWKDTWKVRVGAEYGLSPTTDVMFGYSYDEAALDPRSVDLATAVSVPVQSLGMGAAHRWNNQWESIFSFLTGSGRRSEGSIDYKLSGWQLMFESRYNF